MKPRTWFLVLGLAVAPRWVVGQVPAVADSSRNSWTTVTYLTGASVYLDAGTRAGLAPGARVDVVRAGQVIAELAVEFVSSTRSSCRIVTATLPPVVGDSARFRGTTPSATVAATGAVSRPVVSASTRRGGSLRGRVGLRYFSTEFSGAAGAITQPALDARLDGQSLGGTALGVSLDVRAHRTRRAGVATPENSSGDTRIYQAALHVDGAAGPGRLTLGRQFATALSPVGLFDGLSADYTWAHTGAGLFAGSQPDVVSFGVSSAIREYGAWFRLHNAPGDPGIWSVTTGAIGSYAQGEVNREFLYLQGQFVNRVVSLVAAQELDYNRGWRAAAESTTTTPTSTFATARVALGPLLSVNAGFDNRRSIRLYRDFVSPETEFDDSFRRGTWAGIQLASSHVQASADARTSQGGSGGSSDSWTASAGLTRLTPLGLGLRARATRYAGTHLEGELRSASLELQPGGRFRLDVSAGNRTDIRPLDGTEPSTLRWLGADFDTGIGRSWYLTLSMYRERGADGRMLQYFGSLSYRF